MFIEGVENVCDYCELYSLVNSNVRNTTGPTRFTHKAHGLIHKEMGGDQKLVIQFVWPRFTCNLSTSLPI